MARTASNRLNFLGVISLLVGIAAFVAVKMPIAGYRAVPIALLGIGVGLLAFLASLALRWGSGMPVLGILVSLGALAFAAYDNGTLPAWWAKLHSPIAAPAPAVTPPPVAVQPRQQSDSPHIHSIFDDPNLSGGAPSAGQNPAPPTVVHATTPAAVTPAPTPAIPQPPTPTVAEARAKLDAATAAVEASLANDPAYIAAKADAAAADEKRKAALADYGPGTPQVQDAASQWLDAKSKLKRIVDTAVAKNPAAQAAQRELNAAQAGAHGQAGGRR